MARPLPFSFVVQPPLGGSMSSIPSSLEIEMTLAERFLVLWDGIDLGGDAEGEDLMDRGVDTPLRARCKDCSRRAPNLVVTLPLEGLERLCSKLPLLREVLVLVLALPSRSRRRGRTSMSDNVGRDCRCSAAKSGIPDTIVPLELLPASSSS